MVTLRATITIDYLGPDAKKALSDRLLWVLDQAVRNGTLTDGLPDSVVEEVWADVCAPAEHAYEQDTRVGSFHLGLNHGEVPEETPW